MRKIKLNPTRAQRMTLNRFAHAARYTYNECVAAVNRGDGSNKMKLRNAFVTAKNNDFFADKQWLLETPKVIRQQAAFEAAKNFKAAMTNKRNGNIDHFQLGFKTKRTKSYVLGLEKHLAYKETDSLTFKNGALTILPESVGRIRCFEKPPIVDKPASECSVMRDAYGDFWLLVPVTKAVKTAASTATLSIDPGVRTPFSCYSPEARAAYLGGVDTKRRVEEVQRRVAVTDARVAAAASAGERRKLLRHRLRLFRKYQRVRDDCHWKTIGEMTDRFGTVLLPHLETSRLCGGLRAKSNRQMFGISHYLFKQRMAEKCEEKGVTFVEADEAYTSKTCGACGALNAGLGSSELFKCPACGLRCHRDLHAARNIYLRWICENGSAADMLGTAASEAVPMAS
jgi:transposase